MAERPTTLLFLTAYHYGRYGTQHYQRCAISLTALGMAYSPWHLLEVHADYMQHCIAKEVGAGFDMAALYWEVNLG